MRTFYAIHVAAENDRNGNPRRAYMVYDDAGGYVGTVDEGYRGQGALGCSGLFGDTDKVIVLARVDTTPRYYRDALKDDERPVRS